MANDGDGVTLISRRCNAVGDKSEDRDPFIDLIAEIEPGDTVEIEAGRSPASATPAVPLVAEDAADP